MEGRRGFFCRRDGPGAGHLVIRRQQRAPDGSLHTRIKLDTRLKLGTRAGGNAFNSPEPKLRALEKTRCTYRPKKPPGTVARCIEVSQVHRVFSDAPSFLRCIEVAQVHRSFNGVSKATRMVGAVGLRVRHSRPRFASGPTGPRALRWKTPSRFLSSAPLWVRVRTAGPDAKTAPSPEPLLAW